MPFQGTDVCIAMSAIVWVQSSTFPRTAKPQILLGEVELEQLYKLFYEAWLTVRDKLGVEGARMAMLGVELTPLQSDCLKQCLAAVLNECDGNTLELELRVGQLANVTGLLSSLKER